MKLVSLFLVFAACGGSTPATSTTTQPMKKADEHQMSPALTKFHDVLSPRWHTEKGAKRMTDTCGAIAEFQTSATGVANKDLSDAVVGLEAACKANDATAFEPAFEKVHTTFHVVMEAGEHDDHHEEHKHGG